MKALHRFQRKLEKKRITEIKDDNFKNLESDSGSSKGEEEAEKRSEEKSSRNIF